MLDSDDEDETEIQNLNLLNTALNSDKPSIGGTSSQGSVSSFCSNSAINSGSSPQSKIEIALALNKLTDEKLKRLENILVSRLSECRMKLDQMQGVNFAEASTEKESFSYQHCGKPYFKNSSFVPAPENNDTLLMKKAGMFDMASLSSIQGWTVKDKRKFNEVLHQLLIDLKRKELESQISQYRRDIKNNVKTAANKLKIAEKELGKVHTFSVCKLAKPIEEEYDWDYIAGQLNYRHTPQEYRALWKLFLHPSVNKSGWQTKEHNTLKQVAENYQLQNWDEIARELNTNRTGYQCFVYFRTNISKSFAIKKWTKEEEEYLKRLVEFYKVGNYISWNKIAQQMTNRTKLQIYNKYLRTLCLDKKGRFLPEEDAVLLTCVNKYGPNFKEISKYMHGRNIYQLRGRYEILCQSNRVSAVWTAQEDKRLLQIVSNQDNGVNYAELVQYFPGKNRVVIRSRHLTLLKWIKMHPKLDISYAPRRGARRLTHGQAKSDLSTALCNLKQRMETEVKSVEKNNKINNDTPEYMIDDAIIVHLFNERLECQETPVFKIAGSKSNDLNITNLRKLLILLHANLDMEKFKKGTKLVNEAGLLNTQNEVSLVRVQSYSKKSKVTVMEIDQPTIWAPSNRLSTDDYILTPHFATILGCKKLISCVNEYNYKKSNESGSLNIKRLASKNQIFKQHYETFSKRFTKLFLLPLVLSNISPTIEQDNAVPSVSSKK